MPVILDFVRLISSQETPSGIGDARCPDEETIITQTEFRGVEGMAAVESMRGVRKC